MSNCIISTCKDGHTLLYIGTKDAGEIDHIESQIFYSVKAELFFLKKVGL